METTRNLIHKAWNQLIHQAFQHLFVTSFTVFHHPICRVSRVAFSRTIVLWFFVFICVAKFWSCQFLQQKCCTNEVLKTLCKSAYKLDTPCKYACENYMINTSECWEYTHTQGALAGIDIQSVYWVIQSGNRQTARALKITGSKRQTADFVNKWTLNHRFHIIWFKLSNRAHFENNLVQTIKLRVW